jgi:hypothetical protein
MSSSSVNGNRTMHLPQGPHGGPPRQPPRDPHNPFRRSNGASISLGDLYEHTSRHGRRYLVGRLGTSKIFVVDTAEDSRGHPVWRLYLGDGPYTPENSAALAAEVEGDIAAAG